MLELSNNKLSLHEAAAKGVRKAVASNRKAQTLTNNKHPKGGDRSQHQTADPHLALGGS